MGIGYFFRVCSGATLGKLSGAINTVHEKSGKTFVEQVTNIRMKKARTLLKNGNMTVENIALAVGYQNVEHFTRTFRRLYHMTPVQYRNER